MIKKPVVGIFSRDEDCSYRFLIDTLEDDYLEVITGDPIDDDNFQFLQDKMSACHFAIIFHVMTSAEPNKTNIDSLYGKVIEHLSKELGRDNVLVVVNNLDCTSEEDKKILDIQPLIKEKAADLILFNEETKKSTDLFNETLQRILSCIPKKDIESKTKDAISDLIMRIPVLSGLLIFISKMIVFFVQDLLNHKPVVGIFSRCSDSSYTFLIDFLMGHGLAVRSFTITDNCDEKLEEEICCCRFAILYHSMNSGDLKTSGVAEFVYKKEIEHLSGKLGKKNLLMVVDDLDVASEEDNEKILERYPLIKDMAADLRIFNEEAKYATGILAEKLKKTLSHIKERGTIHKVICKILVLTGLFAVIHKFFSSHDLPTPIQLIRNLIQSVERSILNIWDAFIQFLMTPIHVFQFFKERILTTCKCIIKTALDFVLWSWEQGIHCMKVVWTFVLHFVWKIIHFNWRSFQILQYVIFQFLMTPIHVFQFFKLWIQTACQFTIETVLNFVGWSWEQGIHCMKVVWNTNAKIADKMIEFYWRPISWFLDLCDEVIHSDSDVDPKEK